MSSVKDGAMRQGEAPLGKETLCTLGRRPALYVYLSVRLGKLYRAIPLTEDMYIYQNNGPTFEDANVGLWSLGLDCNSP
jgi:hypothetical protein